MVVRTEKLGTSKTECHIFHETETLVCLFIVFFFRFLLLFVCLPVVVFFRVTSFYPCIIWHHRLYFPSSQLIAKR